MEFYRSNHHDQVLPIEGVCEAISLLEQTYSIHVITARPSEIRDRTERLLDRYFPGKFAAMHFTGYHMNVTGKKILKSAICRDIDAKFFIDDALPNARDVAGIGCRVLLPDKPWNREPLPEGVTRVHSWDEIIEHIFDHVRPRIST